MADPITGGVLGGVGLGLDIWGTLEAESSMKQAAQFEQQAAQYSQQITGLEQQTNVQRRLQMNLNANRQNIENLRNVQKAQAMGLTKATASGAQYGSSIQQQEGAAAAEGAFNTKGIRQNVEIGENIFDIQSQESLDKILISQSESSAASAKGQAAQYQGWASIGSGLMGAAGPFSNLIGKS